MFTQALCFSCAMRKVFYSQLIFFLFLGTSEPSNSCVNCKNCFQFKCLHKILQKRASYISLSCGKVSITSTFFCVVIARAEATLYQLADTCSDEKCLRLDLCSESVLLFIRFCIHVGRFRYLGSYLGAAHSTFPILL